MFICQFRTAIPALTNRHGEDVSILQGLFHRTIYMLSIGIKPVFVFDGIPPESKRAKVGRDGRVLARSSAQLPGPDKQRDLKKLLSLLGVPFIQAPSEAEATCAALVKSGHAWGAVTEDMDALPFGCTRLIRNLKADKNKEIREYNLPQILEILKLSQQQFVDLCILLGCDYTSKVRNVGVKKAVQMMQKHKSIEKVLAAITQKEWIPPDFEYQEARRLFLEPNVLDVTGFKVQLGNPDNEGVIQFLCGEKFLNKTKIENALMKLQPKEPPKKRKAGSRGKDSSPGKQRKINEFFPARKSATQTKSSAASSNTG
ncbi:flap endonuclease 1-like isoform X2 [Hyperolius riggenbachi]